MFVRGKLRASFQFVDLSRIYAHCVPMLRSIFPKIIWSGDASVPSLYLTYDDGPHAVHTANLLDLLKARDVKATFFLLGNCLSSAEARNVVWEMYSRGHCIGIHGFSHRPFACMRRSQLKDELNRTRDVLGEILGKEAADISLVRPPKGAFAPWQVNWLIEWGFRLVMCTVLPQDWRHDLTVNQIVHRAIRDGAKFGSIVALHDGEPTAGSKVVEVTMRLLDALRDGRSFMTISESLNL